MSSFEKRTSLVERPTWAQTGHRSRGHKASEPWRSSLRKSAQLFYAPILASRRKSAPTTPPISRHAMEAEDRCAAAGAERMPMMKDARGGVCFEPSSPFGMPAIDRRTYRREPFLPPFARIGRWTWRPARSVHPRSARARRSACPTFSGKPPTRRRRPSLKQDCRAAARHFWDAFGAPP